MSLLAISRRSFEILILARYLILNDHFSHAECNISFQTIIFAVLIILAIRYRSTEQHLKSHSNEILFINRLFNSAVICESRQ